MYPRWYIPSVVMRVEWPLMRAYLQQLVREAKSRGLTQKDIAARGGLSGQSAVSKLIKQPDRWLGPRILELQAFLVGIGGHISLVDFFRALTDARQPSAGQPSGAPPRIITPTEDEQARLDREAGQAIRLSIQFGQDRSTRAGRRSPAHQRRDQNRFA